MPLLDSGAALYAGGADEFVVMAPASRLTAHLTREFARRYGAVNESEARSWRNSLTALAAVVERAGLHHAGVGVELRLPSTSRRVDASFVGRDAGGRPQVVLCELKQWETAAPSAAPDNVLVGGRETLHPSVQAAAYADYLRQSHSAFTERGFGIAACAYLHNMDAADARGLRGLAYAGATREAPFYVRGDEAALGSALAGAVGGGDGAALLPDLVAGRFSPSKQLLDGIAAGLKGSAFWTLLDEQRAAYNVVRGLVERAAGTGEKAVVVITGGPGTGKSVIAAHLVLALSKNGAYRAAHSTASKAFTTNLRAVGGRSSEAVFRWNKDFGHKLVDADVLDVLVVDEAHRVRKSSNTQYTPKRVRSEIPQADELIRAARVSVFLLDERQNVRPDEIGNVAAIEEAAVRQSVPLRRFGLDAQFRCNGSSAYVAWVDALMSDAPVPVGGWAARGGEETPPNAAQEADASRASGTATTGVQARSARAGEYDIRLADSPAELEALVRARAAAGQSARLVAGYCWPWSDPAPDGTLVRDVRIDTAAGDWAMPWNEKSPEQFAAKKGSAPRPDRHPYTIWATRPEGIEQVGCIYSAQGFEFDYCGVILGQDLVWREDGGGAEGWLASRDASFDPSINRRRLTADQLAAILQHTYRVLFTRGMRGTAVYSTDVETQAKLRDLLRPAAASPGSAAP